MSVGQMVTVLYKAVVQISEQMEYFYHSRNLKMGGYTEMEHDK